MSVTKHTKHLPFEGRSIQQYHTKNPEVVPSELRTPEWFETVVCKALGYSELKSWQLEMIISLCNGRDGFLTVPTGEGKSTLVQGPIVADLAAGIDSIGVTLVPTKCLADDQARSASAKGIRALALHEDSVSLWVQGPENTHAKFSPYNAD